MGTTPSATADTPASADTTRRLVVMRHAKAEQSGSTDRERALTDRGQRDAREAGQWLAARGVLPDAALVSDARRTRQTWQALCAGLADASPCPEPELSSSLYAAGPDTALDLLLDTEPEARTLVVIGHNPTMGSLVQLLDDGHGDTEAATQIATGGYPTCALTVFDYEGDWAALRPGGATVAAFHVGRG